MAKFELVGSPEPFLLVDLVQGEKYFVNLMQWS